MNIFISPAAHSSNYPQCAAHLPLFCCLQSEVEGPLTANASGCHGPRRSPSPPVQPDTGSLCTGIPRSSLKEERLAGRDCPGQALPGVSPPPWTSELAMRPQSSTCDSRLRSPPEAASGVGGKSGGTRQRRTAGNCHLPRAAAEAGAWGTDI